jgi:glutaredoxin 3
VNDDASSPGVTMYSTGWCPYCDRARGLLKRSGGRRTVPQIFIGDRHVGGYDDLSALDRTGELDKLLGRA